MNTALQISTETMSKLALAGDVGGLNPPEKIQYYAALCERVGLDPATQPFKLMRLSGKEVFYLDRSGAQQLNRLHQISHEIKTREFVNGCYVVTARASIGNRFTDSIGAVACEGLKGEALANATMKAETKAKRRATLDLVGLGMLDETEVETIPAVQNLNAELVPMPQRQIDDVKQAKVTETKPATASDAHRNRLIELLTPLGPAALEYCQKSGMLIPTEELADLPLRFVPATVEQKDALMAAVQAFVDGGEAKKPDYCNDEPIAKSLDNIRKAAQPAGNRIVGLVQAVSEKPGTNKKGKPYVKIGVKIADGWLNSFSETIAATCRAAKDTGQEVDIEYKDGQYGREILSCIPVPPQDNLPM